jgi:hypothetical protein
MYRNQPRSGFLINLAQITNPFRVAGFVAANLTARGVENDSAKRTKGCDCGIASTTKQKRSA